MEVNPSLQKYSEHQMQGIMWNRVARFSFVLNTKICQTRLKYSKQPFHKSNNYNIYQMVVKCTKICHSKAFQNAYTKIHNSGLQLFHLATLVWNTLNRNLKDRDQLFGQSPD
jgi:hypothetical protein